MALNIEGVRLDPVNGYNFLITLIDTTGDLAGVATSVVGLAQNVVAGGFTECSGLEMNLEVEERQVGGENHTVRKFATRVTWSNIRLKRGVSVASNDLWNWHYGFTKGNGRRRDGLIILQNDLHVPIRIWHFTRGLPVRWTGPTLDASRSAVAIEELEIAHEGLEVIGLGEALAAETGFSI